MIHYDTVTLHDHPTLKHKCIELLNSQWPRSVYAREISLDKCSEEFPVSLLLTDQEQENIVAYAKLCRLPSSKQDVWIESVVVAKSLRGQGLGREMMRGAEVYALQRGFTTAFLSTHDQQGFYEHLGYTPCPPVLNIGAHASLIEGEQFKKFRESLLTTESAKVESNFGSNEINLNATNGPKLIYNQCSVPNQPCIEVKGPPAPPPPPPPLLNKSANLKQPGSNEQLVMVFMKKNLVPAS